MLEEGKPIILYRVFHKDNPECTLYLGLTTKTLSECYDEITKPDAILGGLPGKDMLDLAPVCSSFYEMHQAKLALQKRIHTAWRKHQALYNYDDPKPELDLAKPLDLPPPFRWPDHG